ncbi:MAG TPA: SusD/RagB family nutrient-binding outer membrane lipoprotein, partial [Chitinophagaceae bacterium]|nr:SusD/RagB family nutrient-binding outer membrane lipoprotein [Chitinophagaceae bacterium]
MKKIILFAALSALLVGTGCKKYLNINSDPDTTQDPSVSSVLPALLSATSYGIQRDGRYVSHYIANFGVYSSAASEAAFDNHGYTFSSTNSGDLWWMNYFLFGKNVSFVIEKALKTEQYDYLGVAYALRAWGFQTLTDYSGEIIYNEAWKDSTYFFHYDTQETVYHGVDSLCRIALQYLTMANSMPVKNLAKGDMVYNGDISKWRKFVYGLLAHNYGHLTNKTGIFQADSVIKYCDSSFASANDDFTVPFDATRNDNANFWGTYRNNMGNYRQSNFIVRLLDGTTLAGSNTNPANRDPRLSQMLCASSDTTNGNGGYYGVDPGTSEQYVALNPPASYLVNGLPPTSGTALTNWKNARKKTCVPWGDSTYANPSAAAFSDGTGKYLFRNRVVMPLMTYSELQFIKAEAAYKKNNMTMAYDAYLKGINGHFDFINRSYSNQRASLPLYNVNPITT